MGLFDTIKEPVFLKESSSAEKQLEALMTLKQQASGKLLQKIEDEIKIVEAGIYGENQIMFELKNSHMPMAVLHDLYYEKDGFTAQIDYLIITKGRSFIIECKNLIGNIDIDSSGNFVRTLNYGKFYRKEGVYSPITQNQRHLEMIKKIRMDAKGNVLTKTLFEKYFPDNYRSVVVLANEKTVLNAKYAKKEVKNQVIRADQLISFIKSVNSEKGVENRSEKEMMKTAQFFLEKSIENPADYLAKYREELLEETEMEKSGEMNGIGNTLIEDAELKKEEAVKESTVAKEKEVENDNIDVKENTEVLCPRCGAPMVKRIAKKGTNAGREFYGCSRYPKCRGIVNLDK